MAVTSTTTTTPEGKIITTWSRTASEPDFFATYDDNKAHKPIVFIGYAKNIHSPFRIFEPNYAHPLLGTHSGETLIRGKFESFLLQLYAEDIFIADGNSSNDLDKDMVKAGLLDKNGTTAPIPTTPYDDINILDFMVLTKAKVRNYKQPDGTLLDLLSLGPGDTRPNLTDVPNLEEDQATMKAVLKNVGMKGFIQYLYNAEAITFETFNELFMHFFPEKKKRIQYYQNTMRTFFKIKRLPMFSLTELEALGLKQ